MSYQIIDGVEVAKTVNLETAMEVTKLVNDYGVRPGLVVVRVGEDPASRVYVNMKVKKCSELGIHSVLTVMPEETTQEELICYIDQLNKDNSIHGILVQLPLPSHLDEDLVINSVSAEKDVDCFHPVNVGKMLIGDTDGFFPCTPHGVQVLLERSNIKIAGKHVVVIGRSNIVGKPLAALLVQKGSDATVTICHSRSNNMEEITRQADVLVSAVGIAGFVKASMVKDGAVVVDVGINRVSDSSSAKGF
ncbi:MAG: bifunctional 5,10-methylenetetrahydrofolate dehydrogenase/5,10-methenyltetrahydrofolate cyclohydrolase, partial [Lentisphaeria bacterium]